MAKKAKGRASRRAKTAASARSRTSSRRPVKRTAGKAQPKGTRGRATAKRRAARSGSSKHQTGGSSAKRAAAKTARTAKNRVAARRAAARKVAPPRTPGRSSHESAPTKTPRLDRVRRTLDDTVPTPPSSLNMDRHGSAARTGRQEAAETLEEHRGMSPAITAGDVDVDIEDAYFTGDEAPGGDNTTPDQDIVDDIGKALGVQYDDNEELKASEKIVERDRHRWEMDPASSEDYKDRK
jgi:hypothetical protein